MSNVDEKVKPLSASVLDQIQQQAKNINAYAEALHVPPTSIAGGVARELNRQVYESSLWDYRNAGAYVVKNWLYWSDKTDQAVRNDFNNLESNGIDKSNAPFYTNYRDPLLHDVGPASISPQVAIRALDYYNNYINVDRADPLGLKPYYDGMHLVSFVSDLSGNGGTAVNLATKISAVIAVQTKNAIIQNFGSATWDQLTPDQQALMVTAAYTWDLKDL